MKEGGRTTLVINKKIINRSPPNRHPIAFAMKIYRKKRKGKKRKVKKRKVKIILPLYLLTEIFPKGNLNFLSMKILNLP